MSESGKEAWTGWALFGGIALAFAGVVLTVMLYMGGTLAMMKNRDVNMWAARGLGPALILLGLLTAGAALLYGIREGRRVTSGKGALMDPTAKVMARYAYDREGNMVVDEWLFDERDDPKFYVKLELTGGSVREFQCRREVHAMCGEGMTGAATFDGRWLGSFVPQMGGGQGSAWRPHV
jgi:hypothetical protein